MAYRVKKITDGDIEFLPDITETPIWRDFDEIDTPRSVRLVAALYRAVAERENYYQENTPTAFGDPEFKLAYGIAQGIEIAGEIEERARDGKLFFYKGKKLILVVDKPMRTKYYYEALADVRKTREAFGF